MTMGEIRIHRKYIGRRIRRDPAGGWYRPHVTRFWTQLPWGKIVKSEVRIDHKFLQVADDPVLCRQEEEAEFEEGFRRYVEEAYLP